MTRIQFFGRISEPMGTAVSFDIPGDGLSICQLRGRLAEAHACDDLREPSIRAAINDEIVDDMQIVSPGDDVSFFSPLSGG